MYKTHLMVYDTHRVPLARSAVLKTVSNLPIELEITLLLRFSTNT